MVREIERNRQTETDRDRETRERPILIYHFHDFPCPIKSLNRSISTEKLNIDYLSP